MITKPHIVPRYDWRAEPARGGLVYPQPLSATYYRGTLHHDAAKSPATYEQALVSVREHQQLHFREGWSDIGYHYLIAPTGQIIEGRSISMQGAHVLDENGGNVGICLMGELHKHPATAAQLDSVKKLWAWLCQELDMDSGSLKGHCDYLATICPGSAHKEIPAIRAAAKAALTWSPNPIAKPSLLVGKTRVGDLLIVDGQAFAPVRALGEALGKKVSWNPVSKEAHID